MQFRGCEGENKAVTLIGPGSGLRGSIELAVGDLPGLARLGLLERPAMVVGLDLLDGNRG